MNSLGGFLTDLKRRHIYRVAAVYAVVAWVLIQLVGNLTPMLRLAEWVGAMVLALLLVVFPIALIFAWIHERPTGETSGPSHATTKLDWILAGGVSIVVATLVGNAGNLQSAWNPGDGETRRTERFRTLIRQFGLVDYWRDRGWPDLCRPVGDDDFVCD